MTNKLSYAYIGLGSNLNNPKQQIKQALISLDNNENIFIIDLSKLYLSKPLLNMPLPDFYNAVVKIKTNLSAYDLLIICQEIEVQQHRVREKKWGSRTIDLDILLFDNEVINSTNLTIPHPEIQNRSFVLKPLADIAPSLVITNVGIVSDLVNYIDCENIKEYPNNYSVKKIPRIKN